MVIFLYMCKPPRESRSWQRGTKMFEINNLNTTICPIPIIYDGAGREKRVLSMCTYMFCNAQGYCVLCGLAACVTWSWSLQHAQNAEARILGSCRMTLVLRFYSGCQFAVGKIIQGAHLNTMHALHIWRSTSSHSSSKEVVLRVSAPLLYVWWVTVYSTHLPSEGWVQE